MGKRNYLANDSTEYNTVVSHLVEGRQPVTAQVENVSITEDVDNKTVRYRESGKIDATQGISVKTIEEKKLDYEHDLKSKAGGKMGTYIGINLPNVVFNIALLFLGSIMLIIAGTLIHESLIYPCYSTFDTELIKFLSPLLMTVIGYLFGRGNSSNGKRK